MDKSQLSERDICSLHVTPAVTAAGWDQQTQIREEVSFTAGRIIVRGKMVARGKPKRADYVLYYKPNIPIAVIEAKGNTHAIGHGMQQALGYAEALGVPFVFSTNGDGFLFHDRTVGAGGPLEQELPLDGFPAPDALWQRYRAWKGLDATTEGIVLQDYHDDGSGRAPRYYQTLAINRTVEAIARGQRRLLLVMATGTGKTYTAFQIIWRLWKARRVKRVLFLADRNILVDQTRVNDFKPFGQAMTKITKRQADKSYEIYLALYQAVSGTEEDKNVYKQFSPDFFDLVVVDECHRGSAAADSAWRVILEYFASATQIGLTATPKETDTVSNIDYFGAPIYTYSLKQGIQDGFLAPYRVVRVDLDKDLAGWRPEHGKRDASGELVEDRIYNQKDFDRTLVLTQRTERVAAKVTELLKHTDRFAKTIVFCVDIDHASRMRQALANANADLVKHNHRYVMQITGDNAEGKAELDNFIDPKQSHPVVVTTSKLLSTGVDAQTCKLIVLDQNIGSMTEFKQIIGRGTRINEDYGKRYFTIMDCRKATNLFADPAFDGEPVQVYEPGDDDPVTPPEPEDPAPEDPNGDDPDGDVDPGGTDPVPPPMPGGGEDDGERRRVKYVIQDVPVWVVSERVQYYDADGKLVTESLIDYTRKTIRQSYASLDAFLKRWDRAERKQTIVQELEAAGLLLDAVAAEVGQDLDPFDLIYHIAFDQPALTRRERAEQVRKRDYFTRYGEQARAVLDALLDKYADGEIPDLTDSNVLKLQPFDTMGTPIQLARQFGGPSSTTTPSGS